MDNASVEKNKVLKDLMFSIISKEGRNVSLQLTESSVKALSAQPWLTDIEEIYCVAHGTSYATALLAASWFRHISRIPAEAVEAFRFSRYADDYIIHPAKTLVVAVSCSGNTPSVVLCLKESSEAGAHTVTLSGEGDIECAGFSDGVIRTDCHVEERKKVTAYSVSHLFLAAAAYELAVMLGEKNGCVDSSRSVELNAELETTFGAMSQLPEIFDSMGVICDELRDKNAENYVALGTGPNMGTIQEGALKICEFSWKFGAREELEDFIHGRFREAGSKTVLIIAAPSGKASDKAAEVLKTSKKYGIPTVLLTDSSDSSVCALAEYTVKMPSLPDEYLTPFLYVFPYWFFGYHVMERSGGEVGGMHNPVKDPAEQQ